MWLQATNGGRRHVVAKSKVGTPKSHEVQMLQGEDRRVTLQLKEAAIPTTVLASTISTATTTIVQSASVCLYTADVMTKPI